MKLLVRYKRGIAWEIVDVWIKVNIDVCLCPHAFIVSVSARMSAHKNEHRCVYLSVLSQTVFPPHSIAADFVILASWSTASGNA